MGWGGVPRRERGTSGQFLLGFIGVSRLTWNLYCKEIQTWDLGSLSIANRFHSVLLKIILVIVLLFLHIYGLYSF